MAPSITSPILGPVVKKERHRRHRSAGREETPTSANPNSDSTMTLASGSDLASIFKSDLTNIRSLVTCSICDQLLYEPWTLGCGHTYCYSCLCSWFVPNKRKKTCPECRSRVKQLPAPNFLVKQMVEIFTKRTELMPADESVEQHNTKRAEEIADVEKDKNGPDGLFKGTFPERETQLVYDEEDGVIRCPNCSHEHVGGPACLNCGAEFDDDQDGFSDMDDEDVDGDLVEEMELNFDRELGAERGVGAHENFFGNLPRALGREGRLRYAADAAHHFVHHRRGPRLESSELSNSEDSEIDSEEDEDEGSLQDFVVREDDEPPRPMGRVGARNRQVITILSDDDSDEGGEVSSRRPRRRNIAAGFSSPSALTVTDDSTNGSEAGDMHSEADRLRTAGWSPLDHGTDSDPDLPNEYQERYGYGYGSTLDGNDSDEDSDTNTVGHISSDDEEDHLRDDMSETPTYDEPGAYDASFRRYGQDVYEHLGGDDTDDDSDAAPSVMMDRDGDTEMSASPEARRSTSVSTNPYRNDSESRSSRQPSVSTNYDFNEDSDARGSRGPSVSTEGDGQNYHYRPENLGVANQVHDVQDDSSDASIRPPVRRRRPRYNLNARVQQYDPRISMLFADHQQIQQTGQGSRDHPVELEELDEWAQSDVRRVVEPASRSRRMTAYRSMPARRADPLRSSRSPSATHVISATNRGTRLPRRTGRERSYNEVVGWVGN